MGENNIILNEDYSIRELDTGLSINRNDKGILAYGASKVGLAIYKKKGRLEYDNVERFTGGFAIVYKRILDSETGNRKHKEYNFINKEGNLISKERFHFAGGFYSSYEGFAYVMREDRKQNFIDKNGNFLSKEWFDHVGKFSEGFAAVEKDGKQNFIDRNGNYLSTERFDAYSKNLSSFEDTYPPNNLLIFSEGYAAVKKDGSWNFVDKNGKLLWADARLKINIVLGFSEGYAKIGGTTPGNFDYSIYVNKNGKPWRFNKKIEKPLEKENYTVYVSNFCKGYARIDREKIDNKRNLINKNGDLLSEEWFDSVNYFNGAYARVQKGTKRNFIDKNGKIVSDIWFKKVGGFVGEYATVCRKLGRQVGSYSGDRKGGEWNFIDKNGKILLDKRFEKVRPFYDGYAEVEENGKVNFIDKNGNYLSAERFNHAVWANGYIKVKKNGKQYQLNNKGEKTSQEGYDYVGIFSEGYTPVAKYDEDMTRWNFMDKDGNLLF